MERCQERGIARINEIQEDEVVVVRADDEGVRYYVEAGK